MTIHWGIDLGTSSTTICEDRSGSPRIVNLPGLVKLEPLTRTPPRPSPGGPTGPGGDSDTAPRSPDDGDPHP